MPLGVLATAITPVAGGSAAGGAASCPLHSAQLLELELLNFKMELELELKVDL